MVPEIQQRGPGFWPICAIRSGNCRISSNLNAAPARKAIAYGIFNKSSLRTRLCEKSHCLRWDAGTGWSAGKNPLSGRRECQRSQQGLHSEDVGHPLEVVTEDAQGQLGAGAARPARVLFLLLGMG